MNRPHALLVFFALTVPFGIAVHLASEFASLGRDAQDLAFAPIHTYLGALAIVAAAAFSAYGVIGALLASIAGAFALFVLRLRFGNEARCPCIFCSRKRTVVTSRYRFALRAIAARKPLVRYGLALAVRPPPAFLLVLP